MGDHTGSMMGGIKRDTRSLDHGSYGVLAETISL